MIRRLSQLLFWVALLVSLVFALAPFPAGPAGLLGDKAQHMIVFGVLATLAPLAYPQTSILAIGALLAVYGAVIEFLQAIPVFHRDCDIRDWMADMVAVIICLVLVALFRARVGSMRAQAAGISDKRHRRR